MNQNHIIYDIESILVPIEKTVGKQTLKNQHHLLSIGAVAYINGNYFSFFEAISDMTKGAKMNIVRDFLSFCKTQTEKIEIPTEILVLIENLEEEYEINERSPDKSLITSKIRQLKRLITVPIFGFNSQKYDLKILIDKLLVCFSEMYEVKKINILKRGTNFFNIDTPGTVMCCV